MVTDSLSELIEELLGLFCMCLKSPFQSSFHCIYNCALDRCLVRNLFCISLDLFFAEAQLIELLVICSIFLCY